MIDQDEYILLMKMKDINRYNEIKKEKEKNNNFVDVVSPAPLTDDDYDDMEINETCKIFFNNDF